MALVEHYVNQEQHTDKLMKETLHFFQARLYSSSLFHIHIHIESQIQQSGDDLKQERDNADDAVQAGESTVEIIRVNFCSSDFGDCLTVMMVLVEINHQFITDISDDDDIDDAGVTNEGGNVGAESETHLLET